MRKIFKFIHPSGFLRLTATQLKCASPLAIAIVYGAAFGANLEDVPVVSRAWIFILPLLGSLSTFAQSESNWEQAAGGKKSFEVASVRQSQPGEFKPPTFPLSPDNSFAPNTGIFSADFPLVVYIEFAYKLWLTSVQRDALLEHQPKWIASDSFTIHARLDGNPTKDQIRLMTQALLADRFKLALHFETRTVPVFILTLAKPGTTGPKLRPHSEGPPCDPATSNFTTNPATSKPDVYPRVCDAYSLVGTADHTVKAGSRNTTMELIAASLTSFPDGLNRPVVDRTGITGRYDFTLEWTPEQNGSPTGSEAAQPGPQGTTFLEAVKEQLGLKLEPTKAPIQVPIIDHVERPSEN